MTINEILPLAVMASSLLPGLVIFTLPESRIRLRTTLNLFGALAKLTLVGLLLAGVLVLTGWDKAIETWFLIHGPAWANDWSTRF